jgi:hypothetical protein
MTCTVEKAEKPSCHTNSLGESVPTWLGALGKRPESIKASLGWNALGTSSGGDATSLLVACTRRITWNRPELHR